MVLPFHFSSSHPHVIIDFLVSANSMQGYRAPRSLAKYQQKEQRCNAHPILVFLEKGTDVLLALLEMNFQQWSRNDCKRVEGINKSDA